MQPARVQPRSAQAQPCRGCQRKSSSRPLHSRRWPRGSQGEHLTGGTPAHRGLSPRVGCIASTGMTGPGTDRHFRRRPDRNRAEPGGDRAAPLTQADRHRVPRAEPSSAASPPCNRTSRRSIGSPTIATGTPSHAPAPGGRRAPELPENNAMRSLSWLHLLKVRSLRQTRRGSPGRQGGERSTCLLGDSRGE